MRQFFTKNAQHGNQKRSSSALTPQAIATTPVDSHHPSGTFPVCTHPNSSALAKLVSPFQTQQPVQCKVNNAAALILDRQNRWRSTAVPPNKNLGSDSLCAKSHSCWPAVQILHFKQGLPVLKLQSTGSSTGWVVQRPIYVPVTSAHSPRNQPRVSELPALVEKCTRTVVSKPSCLNRRV